MPTYDFDCPDCGYRFEHRARVGVDQVVCDECGGTADRQFTPCANIVIPAHFKLPMGWADPPKGDPAWENMSPAGARSQIKKPQTESLKKAFDAVKDWS